MAIDLEREDVLTINEARTKAVPDFMPGRRKPGLTTIYRWAKTGLQARDGSRVKLEAVTIGRELVTTREAVKRFFAELARRSGPAAAGESGPPVEAVHKAKAAGLH